MKRPPKESPTVKEHSPSDFFIMNPYSSRLPYFAFGSYFKFINSEKAEDSNNQQLEADSDVKKEINADE